MAHPYAVSESTVRSRSTVTSSLDVVSSSVGSSSESSAGSQVATAKYKVLALLSLVFPPLGCFSFCMGRNETGSK